MSEARISSARQAKIEAVGGVKTTLAKATSYVLLGFKGMTVMQVTDLRNRFRKAGVEYRVIKNTLLQQAVKGTALEGNKHFDGALAGETGVAFSFEDPSAAAKIVKEFRKDEKNEKLQVKLAVLDASVIPGDRVESDLATMPGKDELRAMLLATLQAPMQQLLQQLQAPAQNLVYVLEARRKQLGGGDEEAA
ncbi:MAG: 50S ribosomal protein L10 [Deltaproteobacteria bacterium]|nr:50S ribosomal protein L10 [Deltaproteobacteria bacterium]